MRFLLREREWLLIASGLSQVTNTISNSEKVAPTNGKLEIMDVSAVIAESIRRTHNGESISLLFREDAAALY
jgi:ribose-phosphate pyrophosphokinase